MSPSQHRGCTSLFDMFSLESFFGYTEKKLLVQSQILIYARFSLLQMIFIRLRYGFPRWETVLKWITLLLYI